MLALSTIKMYIEKTDMTAKMRTRYMPKITKKESELWASVPDVASRNSNDMGISANPQKIDSFRKGSRTRSLLIISFVGITKKVLY